MTAVAATGGLPTRLGKYELMMPLAAGGMARIYIGRSTGIGSFERHVVLKLITPERANDHTAVQMFLDEARLAASLNHQNVGQVFEVGEDGGIHYLAMEYVHGQDLRALLAKAGSQGTRVPLDLALTVVAGAAAGLNHAHERRGPDGVPLGIVHRDVSPSNIMIGYDGSVKLLDFGIAKATARSVETQSGIIKGKFAYMAPEQCRGRDVDRRSDVFSLGIILYEITTQHRCFRADSDFDTMHRIVTGDVVRPTRLVQGYPPALEAIVMKALAVDANQRYQSAGLLLEAIESFSVSARMGLSTMSLGRFMRDMFGDQQEPWLMQNGRMPTAPLQPKESTISNTNGAQSQQAQTSHARPTPTPVPPQIATLELPRDNADRDDDGDDPSWNAKSYPATHQPHTAPAMPAPALESARKSNPMPVVQPGAFQAAGSHSGSHPNQPVMTRQGYAGGAGASTAQISEPSYPRYQAPDDGDPVRLRPNRRPLFIGLGLAGVGLIVLLAVTLGGGGTNEDDQKVVMDPRAEDPVLGGGGDEKPTPTVTEPVVAEKTAQPPALDAAVTDKKPDDKATDKSSDKSNDRPAKADKVEAVAKPESNEPKSPSETGSAEPVPTAPEVDTSIALEILSEPSGADVMLSGKPIGTTPLKTTVPKGTSLATLVVHKAKYLDVARDISLADDFTGEFVLKKLDEPAAPKDVAKDTKKAPIKTAKTPPVEKKAAPAVEKKPAPAVEKKPVVEKKKCQPPGQADPFDTTTPICAS